MDLFASVEVFLSETVDEVKKANSDGSISYSEAFSILTQAIKKLVAIAATLNISGADKKQAVMDAVGKAFDLLAAHVDIPWVPELVESTVIDPALKKAALMFADGVVEYFVALLK